MPPLPNVPNALKVALHFHAGEDLTIATRLHFAYSGGAPNNTDATTLAAAGLVEAAANLYPLMANSTSLEYVYVQDLSSATGGTGQSSAGTVGTRGTANLPVGSVVLANYSIQRHYRGGKPRSYWPFGVQGDLADASTFSGGAVTNFNTGIRGFINGMIGQVAGSTTITEQINVSYYNGVITTTPPWRGPGFKYPRALRATPVIDAITAVNASGKPGSQRRRYQRS